MCVCRVGIEIRRNPSGCCFVYRAALMRMKKDDYVDNDDDDDDDDHCDADGDGIGDGEGDGDDDDDDDYDDDDNADDDVLTVLAHFSKI